MDSSPSPYITTYLKADLLQTENHKLPSHSYSNTVILQFLSTNDNLQHPFYHQIFVKNSNLSSRCPFLVNFEQITPSVLFVCVGDSRGFILFLSTKAVCWSTQFVNLDRVCKCKIVCGCVWWAGGHTQAQICICAWEQCVWGVSMRQASGCLCDKITDIHVVGLHNNVRMCVCVRERGTQTQTEMLYIAHGLGFFCKCKGSWVTRAQGEDIPSFSLTADDEKGLSQRSVLSSLAVMADDITY